MKKTIIAALSLLGIVSCKTPNLEAFRAEALSAKFLTPSTETITFEKVLDKHKGKVIVLDVWASWCSDCIKAMPKLKQLQAEYPQIEHVFISMDKDFDPWQKGIKKYNIQGDHYWAEDGMKGVFGKAIDLDWIPRYIIIDKQGNIAHYRAIEADDADFRKKLNELL